MAGVKFSRLFPVYNGYDCGTMHPMDHSCEIVRSAEDIGLSDTVQIAVSLKLVQWVLTLDSMPDGTNKALLGEAVLAAMMKSKVPLVPILDPEIEEMDTEEAAKVVMPFGKYRGKCLEDIEDILYLDWLLGEKQEQKQSGNLVDALAAYLSNKKPEIEAAMRKRRK